MDNSTFFQQFVHFISSVHEVTHEMTKGLKPEQITPVQYSILEYLMFSQPATLSEISDCQHMSMPNTSRELRKLHEKGYCEKYADDEDRRKQRFRLTPAGEALMKDTFARIESRFSLRLKDLTGDELHEIREALQLLQTKVFFPRKS